MLKKLMRMLTVVGIIAVGILLLMQYVKPDEALNMKYTEFSLKDELFEMVREQRTSMVLSEDEVNNLIKAELASKIIDNEMFQLKGAYFELVDGGLQAHLHMIFIDRIHVGMQLTYVLDWTGTAIQAELDEAYIRSISLPSKYVPVQSITLDLSDKLPPLVQVKSVAFEPEGIEISFALDIP